MLGKLIKQDFRGFARTLFPLQIGVLTGGLLATILTRLTALDVSDSRIATVFVFLSVLAVAVLVFAILASSLVTLVLICLRLQRNFFDDEGYLTFSLPVTTGRLLWSKIITGAIWIAINAVVIVITLLIFAAFGFETEGMLINMDVLRGVGGIFSSMGDFVVELFTYDQIPGLFFMVVLGVLDLVAYLLLQLMSLYFAVITGGMIAKKHKLLASVGMYLLIHFVLGLILSVFGVSGFSAMATMVTFSELMWAWTALVAALIVLGGLTAGLFAWARYLLKCRLNLQ